MNCHERVDRFSVKSGKIWGEKIRFFREGIESEQLTKIPGDIEMDFSPPDEEGEYHVPMRYGSEEGVARYTMHTRVGRNKPSLIFHHGSGEHNYTSRIRKILPSDVASGINLISVSIPWNKNMKEYLYGIETLERFCFLISSSVRVIEALAQWLHFQSSGKSVLSGISLGGWITNLHCALYGTIDEYRPIFAGAALDHLFTETVYQDMVSKKAGYTRETLKRVLNFEDTFSAADSDHVYPLLAEYDQYIVPERQKAVYDEAQVSVIKKGHITGSMDMAALRNHLMDAIAQT